jgi:tRNA (guanine-N7-)-methyltransferase
VGRGLKYEIPGEDWRRRLDEVAARGWEEIFSPDQGAPLRLVVEIGFGRGEFLLDLAAKDPESSFVGVEVSFKRTLKMARKLGRSGLRNVRLIEGRGQVVVKELLQPESVHEMWINFSDPWPKERHADRRLLQSEFVNDIARALAPGSRLRVATDDAPYAERIDHVLSCESPLENCFSPDRWRVEAPERSQTGYQEDWMRRGRLLHFFEYCRLGPSPRAPALL